MPIINSKTSRFRLVRLPTFRILGKNFNSKQYAKSILFLTENHLSIDDLPRAVEEACAKADALTAELKKVEAQIASTSQLIDQVRVYLAAVSTYGKMVEV